MNRKREAYNRIAIGKNIKNTRLKKSMTQEELAEHIDKATKYISDIERGKCGMSLETFLQIAEQLDISLDCLVNEELKDG